MCTVTYIAQGNGFFLTSNRDEKKIRLQAQPPQWYSFATGKILFPRDGNAGGTWMSLHANGNAMVLLNGAFYNHEPEYPYRRSRGLIFLDIFNHPQPVAAFDQINLSKIEPFTLIIRQLQHLFEARWDGNEKKIMELNSNQSFIWSSATLYSKEVIQKRKKWFHSFIENNKQVDEKHILNFHRFAGDGDQANDVLMNRSGELFTVSITLLHRQNDESSFQYFDLNANTTVLEHFIHPQSVTLLNEVE